MLKNDAGKPKIPTHFVAFRLQSDAFAAKVVELQQALVHEARAPHLRKCLTSARKLHFTCFVMALIKPLDVEMAINCFHSLRDDVWEIAHRDNYPKQVVFEKLSTFGKSVLYLEATDCPALDMLREIDQLSKARFAELPMLHGESRLQTPWTPHATVAKTSADRKNGRRLRITTEDFDGLHSIIQNEPATVTSLDLLSMTEVDVDGYYRRCASIDL